MSDEGVENTTGSRIYVAVGQADTVEEYAALDWLEVTGIVSMDELGDTNGDVSEQRLNQGRVKHTNGAADGGDRAMTIQHLTVDEGRDAIEENGGGDVTMSLRRQYKSGDTELVYGVFGSLRSRPMEGETIRGYLTSIRVNSPLSRATASEWSTATGGSV